MKKLLMILTAVLLLMSCSQGKEKLKIAIISPSIDHLPLSYAIEKGRLSKEAFELVRFNSGWEAQEALVNEKVDVAIIPFTYVWTARSKGYKVKTISFFERETDGIIADSTISSVKDLENKKIGVLRASTLDAFMYKLSKKEKITYEPVYFRTPAEMIAGLDAQQVSAIITYVPTIQKLNNKYKIIHWFSNDNPEHPCCNLTTTESTINNKKNELRRLTRVLYDITEEINQDKSNPLLIKHIMDNYKLNENQSKDALSHTVFKMNLAKMDREFEYETMKTFLELKYIDKMPKFEEVYQPGIINELQ